MPVAVVVVAPVLLDVGRALYFQGNHDVYAQLVERCYPFFTNLQVGSFLGAMYTGNLLCALASAKHYAAIGEVGISRVGSFLNVIYGVMPVIACLCDKVFMEEYVYALAQ